MNALPPLRCHNDPVEALATKQFACRLTLLVLFVVPTGYIAYIGAVAVHEVLGHGVVAWLIGGSFYGFALMPDGMGWASASSPEHENVVLAAGVVVGALAGSVAFFVARRQRHPLVRVAFLVFSASSLLDALPYVFWNSVFPRPPGDIGRILADVHVDSLRWALIVTSGASWLLATWITNAAAYECCERILGPVSRRRATFFALTFFGLGPAATWFGFDWNQLIEDVGQFPQYVGATLQLTVVPGLLLTKRTPLASSAVSPRCWTFAIGGAWVVAGILLAVLVLWLRHGVSWS